MMDRLGEACAERVFPHQNIHSRKRRQRLKATICKSVNRRVGEDSHINRKKKGIPGFEVLEGGGGGKSNLIRSWGINTTKRERKVEITEEGQKSEGREAEIHEKKGELRKITKT